MIDKIFKQTSMKINEKIPVIKGPPSCPMCKCYREALKKAFKLLEIELSQQLEGIINELNEHPIVDNFYYSKEALSEIANIIEGPDCIKDKDDALNMILWIIDRVSSYIDEDFWTWSNESHKYNKKFKTGFRHQIAIKHASNIKTRKKSIKKA